MKRLLYLICLCFSVCTISEANHIVGAQLYYDYLGVNTYRITFVEYRNCLPCPDCSPYDDPIYIQLFDTANNYIDSIAIPLPQSDTLAANNSAHCNLIQPCVEVATYQKIVTLPAIPGGYTLVYQRCCRTNNLTNVPQNTGSTYFIAIADSTSLYAGDSKPRFAGLIPLIASIDTMFSFDFSATDPDHDSLAYRLTYSYDGAMLNCPDPSPHGAGSICPTSASPPPYASVPYTAPYTYLNPTNNPSDNGDLHMDSMTGILTGVVNQSGVYLVAVAADEYRGGVLIGTTQMDFELIFTNCMAPSAVSAMPVSVPKIYSSGEDVIIEPGDQGSVKVSYYDLLGRKVGEDSIEAASRFVHKWSGTQTLIVKAEQPGKATEYKMVTLTR